MFVFSILFYFILQIDTKNNGINMSYDVVQNSYISITRTIYRVQIKLIWQAPTWWYYLHKTSFVRYVTITYKNTLQIINTDGIIENQLNSWSLVAQKCL